MHGLRMDGGDTGKVGGGAFGFLGSFMIGGLK